MTAVKFQIHDIPAILYGVNSNRIWLFVHGKCGYKEEAEAFAEIACPKGAQVLAIDLPEHGKRKSETGFDPWHVVPELREVMAYLRQRWMHICLRANSIGAWFSMLALPDMPPEQALFVSPVLDMEQLIRSMMIWASVDEAQLEREGEIPTNFGETLSWDYLQYAKAHPIVKWAAQTAILYAGQDNLTDRGTVNAFVSHFGCNLTVMENGEHWFHTPEQLNVLKSWEETNT
ncbi:MAG: alpha/beta hydrolase [Intestinimonas sp.]|nr:alpha/beta hydrolase [Intestinimonas sp.]